MCALAHVHAPAPGKRAPFIPCALQFALLLLTEAATPAPFSVVRFETIYIFFQAAISKWIKGKKAGEKKPALKQNMMLLEEGQDCVIVGTLYKEQKLKPNILDEHHARQKYEAPPPARSKYHDDTDDLVLEDQTGRVTLSTHPEALAHLPVHELVTGVVMGVRGIESADGTFKVRKETEGSRKPPPARAARTKRTGDPE